MHQYEIVAFPGPKTVSRVVSEMLNQGWTLAGSPFAMSQSSGPNQHDVICQALTRYAPAPAPFNKGPQ